VVTPLLTGGEKIRGEKRREEVAHFVGRCLPVVKKKKSVLAREGGGKDGPPSSFSRMSKKSALQGGECHGPDITTRKETSYSKDRGKDTASC